MLAEETFNISDVYRSVAWSLGPVVVAALILLGMRFYAWFSGREKRPSETVPKTTLARLDSGLPLDLSLIAGLGRDRQAPQTFDESYLRPTLGLRLIMFGFPVALYMLFQALQTTHEIMPLPAQYQDWFIAILFVLMVHNIIYFTTYELRYDRDRIIHRTWLYQRRELPAAQLIDLRDDGMYFYILRTDHGAKAYLPKHLVGIEDFISYVKAEIAKNEAKECPNYPK